MHFTSDLNPRGRFIIALISVFLMVAVLSVNAGGARAISRAYVPNATIAKMVVRDLSADVKRVTIPAGAEVRPVSAGPLALPPYLNVIYGNSELQVPASSVVLDRHEIPLKQKLAWVFGWNITDDPINGFGVCDPRACYFLLERGSDFGSPVAMLVTGWLCVMLCALLARLLPYEDAFRKDKLLGFLFLFLPAVGATSIGLWFVLVTRNWSHLFAAIFSVEITAICLAFVTIRCRTLSEESWGHKLAAIGLACLIVGLLNVYLESRISTSHLLSLMSPIALLYALGEQFILGGESSK